MKFESGIKETWLINRFHKKLNSLDFPVNAKSYKRKKVNIFHEYPLDPLEELPEVALPHFLIQYKDLKKAGFIDTRFVVHELIARLLKEGWIEPKYLPETLEFDRQRLLSFNLKKFEITKFWIDHYVKDRGPFPGYYIMSSFMETGKYSYKGSESLAEAWASPHRLWMAINALIRKKRNITRATIIKEFSLAHKNRVGPRFTKPAFYLYVMGKYLNLKNPIIYDMAPMFGQKLIATGLMKGTYLYRPDAQQINESREGFAKYFGIPVLPDDGRMVDIAFTSDVDPLTAEEAVEKLNKVRHRAKMTIVFVKGCDRDRLVAMVKPMKTCYCICFPRSQKQRDFMFIFGPKL